MTTRLKQLRKIGRWKSKGEIAKVIYENDISGVDFAIPLAVSNAIRDLGLDPFYFVYSYKEVDCGENRHGVLVNLAEKFHKELVKAEEEDEKQQIAAMRNAIPSLEV